MGATIMQKTCVNKRTLKHWVWGYFFVAPTIIGLIILNIYPIIDNIVLSFQKSLGFGRYSFVGLENYRKLFQDVDVWIGLKNTIVFSAISVPMGILISLVFAWLMSKPIKGTSVYRVIYFMPMIAASAAVTMVWAWIYNTQYGILNYILSIFHVPANSWLNDPKYAMFSIIVIAVWGSIGQQIIILTVAIKNVPKDYYEAAALDGATDFDKLLKITVPLISPSVFFLTVTGFIGALCQFDLIYMIYGTASNTAVDSVKTIMYMYYKESFVINDKGYGAAIAVLTLVITVTLTVFQMWLQKKVVVYQ